MTQQQPEDDAIRHIFRFAEQDIRQVVKSERNAQDLADHYRLLADDQRERITALEQQVSEARALDMQLDRYRLDLTDAHAANRAYAALLTAIREALGAEEDADLVEEFRRIRAESEGRRKALEQVSEERRVEWQRAERAEQRAADFEAMAQRHDEERNRALERAGRYESVLRSLVDAVAGEQEDPVELARALGEEAPYWITRARDLLGERE